MNKKVKFLNLIYPIISVAMIILIWVIIAAILDEKILMPNLQETFSALFSLLKKGSFYLAVLNTLLRSLVSFIIALALAFSLAIIASQFKPVEKIFLPFVMLMRVVPTMSIILLAIIWMKSNLTPMFVALLITFPLLYGSILHSIKSVDNKLLEMVKVYKVKKIDIIKSLYIPTMLPSFFNSIRQTISLNLKVIIAAEVLAQTAKSMGLNMQLSKIYLDTPGLFAWTIVAVLLGALLELLVLGIYKVVKKVGHYAD